MMDEETITIAYRDWRGEPRGKLRKAEATEARGDCIDCAACVNVCPMGIDIRDGQQMACITCGLCIDACDDVMDRIDKPRGLIAYLALSDEVSERAGTLQVPVWKHIFRPRTILYTVLWAGVGIGLVVLLFLRIDMDMSVSPIRNPTHVVLSDGAVRNSYEVRLRNMHAEPREFTISAGSEAPLVLSLEGLEGTSVMVPADEMLNQRVYITAPPESPASTAAATPVRIWAQEGISGTRIHSDTVFNGRGN